MSWFSDAFDSVLDTVADVVVDTSISAIEKAADARNSGSVFPLGEVVAGICDVDMEDAMSSRKR